MGKPSDRKRSARRLGKHERARVKKARQCRGRVTMMGGRVGSAGTVHVKAGRKKFGRTYRAVSHLDGDSITPNALVSVERLPYNTDTRQ